LPRSEAKLLLLGFREERGRCWRLEDKSLGRADSGDTQSALVIEQGLFQLLLFLAEP